MARIPILKKDGTPTRMFWSDQADGDERLKKVYRTTDDGRVERSKTLRYDIRRKKLQRV